MKALLKLTSYLFSKSTMINLDTIEEDKREEFVLKCSHSDTRRQLIKQLWPDRCVSVVTGDALDLLMLYAIARQTFEPDSYCCAAIWRKLPKWAQWENSVGKKKKD
jgi:hypothetical protein